MRLVGACLLLGGCTRLLGIEDVPQPSTDARVADAIDATTSPCGTWDEDADGIGDDCDLCPHIPSENDGDADADDVGDLCDPHPGMPDRRVLWEPFNGVPSGWTAVGDWTFANGAAHADATDVTKPPATLTAPGTFTEVTATARLTIDTITPGASSSSAGIQTGTTGGQFYRCAVGDMGAGASVIATAKWQGAPEEIQSLSWPKGYAAVVVTSRLSAVEHLCDATKDGYQIAVRTNVGPTTGQPSVVVDRSVATFDYLFVVEDATD